MKKIVFLLLFIPSINLLAQVQPYDYPTKEQRKVVEEDSLDRLLNDLIDLNPSFAIRELIFDGHEDWSFGEIYNLDGDTLFGYIQVKKYQGGQTSMIIYFKESQKDKKKRYRADKLVGFKIGDKKYVSKKFSNLPPSYIEIIEEGTINLYFTKYRRYSEQYDPVRRISYPGLYPFYEFYLEPLQGDGNELLGPLETTKKEFSLAVLPYINNYPELASKVRNGKYLFSHIQEIIQIYNIYYSK